MTLPLIPNQTARRLFLHRHALAEAPTGTASGAALVALIERLGFAQIDSIATVERAHHMILFARRQSYRPQALTPLLEQHRQLWEHWTHDAAILPIGLYPHWHHRFEERRLRLAARIADGKPPDFARKLDEVLAHIEANGPVDTADFSEGPRPKGGWWDWHPSKAALEYLWLSGELAITRRDSFRKVYDLTARVIPAPHRAHQPSRAETVEWACRSALDHLGFATAKELAAYWAAISLAEAKHWCDTALSEGRIREAFIEGADGQQRSSFLWPSTLTEVPPEPPKRLRVISPFDPALRDRKRAEFLFGFFYRIEIYVPEPKRQYGYYVFPLLEGDRLIGRLDAKAHRELATLRVKGFWPEPGIRLGPQRQAKLEAELDRLARFAGCDRVEFLPGWNRQG